MPPKANPRISLIHAVAVAVEPITSAFQTDWPEAECLHLIEDRLAPDRSRDGALTTSMSARIGLLTDYAVLAGAQAVLFTCSAFGPAIEVAARRHEVPVFKPNQAMFDQALRAGNRIGMLATFAPAIQTMEAEFAEAAAAAGRDAQLRTILVPAALDALKGGDADTHNRLIAEFAPQLADCDTIMLAHFSTSRALAAVQAKVERPVLTSPGAAVRALRAALGA
ncbi:aspartate/glutamate racemase family protein [Devosia sp. A449]